MQKGKINLHIHTYHSDGIHSPWLIVNAAKVLGLSAISITDHNEIAGTLKGMKIAEKIGLIFIPGIEMTFLVRGKPYELVGYFKDEKSIRRFFEEYRYKNGFAPHFNNIRDAVNLIRKYNGSVIVPHPFGRKGIFRRGKNYDLNVDGVEIVNAFTGDKRNMRAKRLENHNNNIIKLGAADMHFFVDDIAKVYTEIEYEGKLSGTNIWENLIGKRHTIKFSVRGEGFSPAKIFFQKPLCALFYVINYPRLYVIYRHEKRKFKKLHKLELRAESA